MDRSVYLPAVAALAGSAIGGFTSLASAWLTQRLHDRSQRLSQEKGRRQSLYKQFVNEASKLYADALMHDQPEMSALVSVYALIGQMRILSTLAVIGQAETVARTIIDTFSAPNKTFRELHELANDHSIDLLLPFTDACRAELEALPDL